jgi:hypothetical protein
MTMDVIITFCFGTDINAVDAPDFRAPIVEAMDASLPVFIRFKYSDLYKNMILKCPPKLSKILSPSTAGLVDLQQLLRQQINSLCHDPEKLKQLPHKMTIYHRLLDPSAHRSGTVPSAGSLYEEAQALLFGGADTVGNTMMVGAFHLLKHPETLRRLQEELLQVWPSLDGKEPRCRELESLPYLNAVIKESLRISSGVVSGLLRVVPKSGARICGVNVPGDVSSRFPLFQILLELRSKSDAHEIRSADRENHRQSYHAEARSSTITRRSSQNRMNSSLSAGSTTQV